MGKPSKGTPADRRLKENKGAAPRPQAPGSGMPTGGKMPMKGDMPMGHDPKYRGK